LEDRADEKSFIVARATNYNSLHLLPVFAGSMDKRRPSKLIPVLRDKKSSKKMGRGWKCCLWKQKEVARKMYRNKENDRGAMAKKIKGNNCKWWWTIRH